MATIDLLYNLSLLVAICVVSGFIDDRFNRNTQSGVVLQGLLFGMAAAIGMLFPYVVIGDAIFDARTVVISVGTVFFGPVAGAITVAMSILARIYIGGSAAGAGIIVILASYGVAYAFYRFTPETVRFTAKRLYLTGLAVHTVMLFILAVWLPTEARQPFLENFAFTVIIVYPLATMVIGKVLHDHFYSKKLIEDLRESQQALNTSLNEKKVLLAEIHHRVKNNLAIISSLISMQSELFTDDEARMLLQETEGRIRSMSLIHELVYQNESYEFVEMNRYLREFEQVVHTMYGQEHQQVNIVISADNVFLNLNRAIPCALIINELITNAYKHAFTGRASGEISVRFTEKKENYVLVVNDNGLGLPDNFNPADATSFGFTIVYGLAQQLQGRVLYHSEEGTSFTVMFPKSAD